VYLLELLLNGWSDFDEIVCVCLSGSLDGLDSRLNPVGANRRGAQTRILRFKMEICVYNWLPLITCEACEIKACKIVTFMVSNN